MWICIVSGITEQHAIYLFNSIPFVAFLSEPLAIPKGLYLIIFGRSSMLAEETVGS